MMIKMYLEVPTTQETQRRKGEDHLRQIRNEKLWQKLRLFSFVLGKFIVILKHLKLSKLKSRNFSTIATFRIFNSNWLIEPNSVFFIFWASVIILLMLWTIIILPYYICFFETLSKQFEIAQIFVDIIFILDILFNFNTAYIDQTEKTITNRKKIALKYIKSWFFIDLISSIPFQVFNSLFQGQNSGYIKLFRLVRLPRVYDLLRITRIFKACKTFKHNTTIGKLMKTMKITQGFLRLIKFMFLIVCVIHITSCFWFVIGKEQDYNSWVQRQEVLDMDHFQQYLMSLYYVFTTLTTVGYGDITPRTPPQQFFALLLIFFGVGLYSYIIGNLTTFFDKLDIRKTALKDKLRVVGEILNRLKIPMSVQQEVFISLKRSFNKQEINWFDAQILISQLPSALKSEVYYFMYSKTVKNIHFFQNKSLGVLMTVVPKLTFLRKQKSTYLYLEDFPADQSKIQTVYFIQKGKANFISFNGKRFGTMLQGSYFGEIEIMMNKSRLFSVEVASSHIDLLVLSKSDFFCILQKCPELRPQIMETAQKRVLKFAKDIQKARKMWPDQSKINLISLSSSESQDLDQNCQFLNFHKQDTNILVSNSNMSSEKLKNIQTWKRAMENQRHYLDVPLGIANKKKQPKDYFIRARKYVVKTLIEKSKKNIKIEKKKSNTVFFPVQKMQEEREKLLEKFPSEFEFSDETHSRGQERDQEERRFRATMRQFRNREVWVQWTHELFCLLDKQCLVLDNIRRTAQLLERGDQCEDQSDILGD